MSLFKRAGLLRPTPPLQGWVVLLGRRIPWLARRGLKDIARCAGSAPIGWLILAPTGASPISSG
jgi:hypothetical protein